MKKRVTMSILDGDGEIEIENIITFGTDVYAHRFTKIIKPLKMTHF